MSDILDYKILDEIDWILVRPDSMIGSLEEKTITTNIISEDGTPTLREVTYSPALLKIFDEVIQNSYDHSKRAAGKHLNKIDVTISRVTGEISVMDNGGIPVEIHPEFNMYVPTMIFGNLRGGSNFNDDQEREGAGRNGLGSKLTNVFSTYFMVETADGKHKYEREYENNMRDQGDEVISKCTKKYTRITFVPDWEHLKCDLDDFNYMMLANRVYEIAACSPHIDITLNGKKLSVKGFESFVKKFDKDALYTSNQYWRVGLVHSKDDFKQTSFVNSTRTWLGGTHIDYVANQIVEGVRAYIEKKTKQDIKPSEIKNHFFLLIDCTVHNPKFNSQTKEFMNLSVSSYGTSIKLDDKFIKQVIKSDIVKEIIEWAENKKKLQELADLKKLNQEAAKASIKNIPKYEPCSQKNNRHECRIFICEGDSAKNPLMSARNPKTDSIFTLRGKPLNIADAKIEQIKKNEEIQNLIKALGVDFTGDLSGLRYGKIIVSTDSDSHGSHILGLMLNNINTKWKSLLKDKVFQLKTPIIRVTKGKQVLEFFTEKEFEDWYGSQSSHGYSVKFLKGLGGNSTEHFKRFMHNDEFIIPITMEDEYDEKMLGIAFGPADNKKTWLYPDFGAI